MRAARGRGASTLLGIRLDYTELDRSPKVFGFVSVAEIGAIRGSGARIDLDEPAGPAVEPAGPVAETAEASGLNGRTDERKRHPAEKDFLPRVSIAEWFPARTGPGNPRAAEVDRLAVVAVFRPGKTRIRRSRLPHAPRCGLGVRFWGVFDANGCRRIGRSLGDCKSALHGTAPISLRKTKRHTRILLTRKRFQMLVR